MKVKKYLINRMKELENLKISQLQLNFPDGITLTSLDGGIYELSLVLEFIEDSGGGKWKY